MASTYYVSGKGSDRHTGLSKKKAFRTFEPVQKVLKAGDTVYVMNGTYTNLNPASSIVSIKNLQANATQPTTIKAYPRHTPILQANRNNWNAVSITGSSHVVIEGLTMLGARDQITLDYALAEKDNRINPATSGNGVQVTYIDGPNKTEAEKIHSTHVTIRNNAVSNFPGGGIATSEVDYVTIEHNVVSGNAYYSPYGTQGITHLRLWNSDANTTAYKIIIRGNTVFDNEQKVPWFRGGGKLTEGHGIMLDTASSRETTGIAYRGRALIANNLIYHNGGSGINIFAGSNPVDVVNNTTYENAKTLTKSGEISFNYSQNGRAYNNIMSARPDRAANNINQSTNIIFSSNLVNNSPAFQASDQLAVGAIRNLRNQDPCFVDAANGNFTLQASSPAINAGIATGALRQDKYGAGRDRRVDMGAFEAGAFPAAGTTIGGPGDDFLLGTAKGETITGGDRHDSLIGGLGADRLRGGSGGDRFVYSGSTPRAALAQSLVTSFDRIGDFSAVGGDRIQLDYDRNLSTVELPPQLLNAGKVQGKTLSVAVAVAYQDANPVKPGQQRLNPNAAVLFGWKNRMYLSVNDAAIPFAASQDLVVAIAGVSLTGNIPIGVLPVANYFA